MESTLKNTESSLKKLVEILHDSSRGFADVGEHLKDKLEKDFFMKQSLERKQMAGDLQNELVRLGYKDAADLGGTAAGALHRTWGDIKAHLGGGDATLLSTAEGGEDTIKKAYADAISEKGISADIRDLLRSQETKVVATHDRVRAMRDAAKAS